MPDSSLLPEWYARVDPRRPEALGLYGSAADCEATRFGADSSGTTLFAGFLFDRHDLISDLALPNDPSDLELLLAAWQQWGEELFDRLDGNYLAAIWDPDRKRLTLGRDAMGFYPIYYSCHQGNLWFSPNVLALAHSGEIPRVPNRQSLALRLANSSPSNGQTFFEGIQRVPPGCRLSWQADTGPRLIRYWDPLPEDDEPWLPDEQVLEEFEPRLQRAVDRCLQQRPDGITFSGGLDSTTIAALASASTTRADKPPLTAYSSVAPPGYGGDDGEPWQQPVTQLLGLPYRSGDASQRLGHRTLMEANLEEIPRLPVPTMVWWVGAFLAFYRSIAQSGGRIMLTGNGGDDWLGVPEWWAADLLRSGRAGALSRFLQSYTGSGGRSWRYGAKELLWRWGLRTLVESRWAHLAPEHRRRILRQRQQASIPPWLCPATEDRSDLLDTLHMRRASLVDSTGKRPISFLRHFNRHALENPFIQFERERNFHEERMTGLVMLHPFLDRRWVEFVSRVSPQTLIHQGQYKGLLRPILAGHLPNLGIETQRKGYPAHGKSFLRQGLLSSLPASWQSSQTEALEALSLIDLRKLPDARPGEALSLDQSIQYFSVLSTEAWVSSHF